MSGVKDDEPMGSFAFAFPLHSVSIDMEVE